MNANLKALKEKLNSKIDQAEAILKKAQAEEFRALTEEEQAGFDALEKEIEGLRGTVAREERAGNFERGEACKEPGQAEEERAFADYILGTETRAGEQNMTMGNNGAIIPSTIANRIIKAVRDRCPILERATRYNVKGDLRVPVWGKANTTHDITVGYQQEFTELTADAGKFTSVDLSGYLAGSLVLIGQSVENNGAFSVTDFIISQMGEEIGAWLEGQLLAGTGTGGAQGALNTTNTLTAASSTAITADELIELQAKVKQVFQGNACWMLHPETFTLVKKLKDGNSRYLLQDDITGEFPYRLLGKPVFLSDNMPKAAAGNKAVLYGDCSGLSVNFRENISIQVLREKYATQHAIGVVAWFEFDSKVTDHQRLAALAMKAGA